MKNGISSAGKNAIRLSATPAPDKGCAQTWLKFMRIRAQCDASVIWGQKRIVVNNVAIEKKK
jgi:hypothetical protein